MVVMFMISYFEKSYLEVGLNALSLLIVHVEFMHGLGDISSCIFVLTEKRQLIYILVPLTRLAVFYDLIFI